MTRTIQVWVTVIQHKYGENIYVANTEDGAEEHVADFCRNWWETLFIDPGSPTALEYEKAHGRRAMIERYFEFENEGNGYESANITGHELTIED